MTKISKYDVRTLEYYFFGLLFALVFAIAHIFVPVANILLRITLMVSTGWVAGAGWGVMVYREIWKKKQIRRIG